MTTIIFSAYGTISLDSEFTIFSTNEAICDGNGNEVDADSPDAKFFVADLIIESRMKRYIFPKTKYGFEFAARVGQALVDSNGKDTIVIIDLHKLNSHIDFELLGASSMKIEYI